MVESGLFEVEIGCRSNGLDGGDEFGGNYQDGDAVSFCLGNDLLIAFGAPLEYDSGAVWGAGLEFLETLGVRDAQQCVSRVVEGSWERDSEACAEVVDIFHIVSRTPDSTLVDSQWCGQSCIQR